MTDYDSHADVYWHESTEERPMYYVSFEPHHALLEHIQETLEGQLGKDYERALDPGEKVYVGQVKYDSTAFDLETEADAWVFNRLPPENLDTDLDGQTYHEETTEDIESADD